ncbi:MAG TPA: hypothetical protein VNC50_19265, partial [Planctomycetia bacterium]|nr:hypothetical protein [Planctomycetia bacterium]
QDAFAYPQRTAAYCAEIAKHPDWDALLDRIDRAPNYSTAAIAADPPMSSTIDALQMARSIARVEAARCRADSLAGKRDDAVRRALRLWRIAAKIQENEAILLALLISNAIKGVAHAEINVALRSGPIDVAVRKQIDYTLAQQEESKALARALAGEMAFFPDNARAIPGLPGFLQAWPLSAIMKNDVACGMRILHEAIERSGENKVEFARFSLRAFDEVHRSARWRRLATGMLLPAYDMIHTSSRRVMTSARCVRILSALQAGGDMSLPFEKLGLPAGVLLDPFDGLPLRRKESPDGILIYSVDQNLKDDGGEHGRHEDWGSFPVLKPPASPAADNPAPKGAVPAVRK